MDKICSNKSYTNTSTLLWSLNTRTRLFSPHNDRWRPQLHQVHGTYSYKETRCTKYTTRTLMKGLGAPSTRHVHWWRDSVHQVHGTYIDEETRCTKYTTRTLMKRLGAPSTRHVEWWWDWCTKYTARILMKILGAPSTRHVHWWRYSVHQVHGT